MGDEASQADFEVWRPEGLDVFGQDCPDDSGCQLFVSLDEVGPKVVD